LSHRLSGAFHGFFLCRLYGSGTPARVCLWSDPSGISSGFSGVFGPNFHITVSLPPLPQWGSTFPLAPKTPHFVFLDDLPPPLALLIYFQRGLLSALLSVFFSGRFPGHWFWFFLPQGFSVIWIKGFFFFFMFFAPNWAGKLFYFWLCLTGSITETYRFSCLTFSLKRTLFGHPLPLVW